MERSRWLLLGAVLLIVAGCATGRTDPYDRAVEHYGKGRVNESVYEYREAIRSNPSNPRAKFNLAVIYQDQGRLDEAEKLYKSILEQHPRYAPAWSNLASIQEASGRADAAEQSYRRAIEADPDDSWAASQFGFFLYRAGRLDEASLIFQESLRRNEKFANSWFGLAEIAEKRGEFLAAVKNYDRAMLCNPSDIEAFQKAAALQIAHGDKSTAIRILRRALKADPHRGDVQFMLGRLLAETGNWKEAETAFEQAGKYGAPAGDCDRELSVVYAKLSELAAEKAGARDEAK